MPLQAAAAEGVDDVGDMQDIKGIEEEAASEIETAVDAAQSILRTMAVTI